jgi:hypothetical protein
VTDDTQSKSSAADEQPTQVTPVTSAATGGAPAGAAPAGTGAAGAGTHAPVPPPVPPVVETGPAPGPSLTDKAAALIDERPEIGAGGAFAGGIVFALILKRIAR